MKWQRVSADWPAFVGPIQQRWPNTTEADLLALDGDRAGLTRYLSRTHDLTQAEADEQIAVWLDGEVPSDVVMDDAHDNENIRASAAHIPPGEDVYSDDGDFGDDDAPDRPVGRTE